jgi:Mlc titration factor MtfA (ptsG expression regulator)
MTHWWQRLKSLGRSPAPIPQALWDATLAQYPFLMERSQADRDALRQASAQFLHSKQFSGAHGLVITDEMALAIAAQACLPVLKLGLRWYDDFQGIVVHPGAMLAPRELHDEAGVVHHYREELSGEAMPGGPVTLSWQDVQQACPQTGYNVVIHEFVHKLDMRDGAPDGCPPLPASFLGAKSAQQARAAWQSRLQASYLDFCDKLSLAERFGGAPVWLDPYAAVSIDEFFAVASEAYFVHPQQFACDFAPLVPMFDAWFGAVTPAA